MTNSTLFQATPRKLQNAATSSGLRVGIDLYPLCRPMSGVGIYIKYLMRELLATSGDIDFSYPAAISRCSWAKSRRERIGEQLGSRGIQYDFRCFPGAELAGRLLPMQFARFSIDLYHITSTLCWFRPSRVPTIVTAYDLAWLRLPESIYPKPRHFDLGRYPRLLRQARHIICISEATRRDVAELARVPEDRLSVTRLAARPEFRPPEGVERATAKTRFSPDRPYFVALGTLEPRKNYPRLIEAFAEVVHCGAEHRLLIVGGKGPEFTKVSALIEKNKLGDRVELKGYLADGDVLECLWGADALVMPSLYEGFGLPVLEAMAAGTPVIASHAGSLPEVAGDAACFVDPVDVESIAHAMRRVGTDVGFQNKLRQQGFLQAAKFTWAETSTGTLAAYRLASA